MTEQGGREKPPQRVGIREFRANLPRLLRQLGDGDSFLVTLRDQVVAEVRAPSMPRARREAGALRGRIRLESDFDLLPADVLAALEGDGA